MSSETSGKGSRVCFSLFVKEKHLVIQANTAFVLSLSTELGRPAADVLVMPDPNQRAIEEYERVVILKHILYGGPCPPRGPTICRINRLTSPSCCEPANMSIVSVLPLVVAASKGTNCLSLESP